MVALLFCLAVVLPIGASAAIKVDVDYTEMSTDELFRQCFCWDKNTDTFCGGEKFWRPSCEHLALRTAGWTIPCILVIFFFVCFPFFFLVFRYCCNCCGGRSPSFGCCCPYNNSRTGPRRYTKCTIRTTKWLAVGCLALFIYFCVTVYTTNHKVSLAATGLMNSIEATSHQMLDEIADASSAAEHVKGKYISEGDAETIKEYQGEYSTRVERIHDGLGHAHDVESNKNYGREHITYTLVSLPLLFLVIMFLFMLCNGRGFLMAFLVSLFSFSCMVLVVALIAHGALAQVSHIGCNNYQQAVIPTVRTIIELRKGCNQQGFMASLFSTGMLFATEVCNKKGLTILCATQFNCSAFDFCAKTHTKDGLINAAAVEGVLSSPAYNPNNCIFGARPCTIRQCAEQCVGNIQEASQAIVEEMLNYGPNITALSGRILDNTRDCHFVMNALNTTIYDAMCGEFKPRFTNITMVFLSLTLLSLFTMYVYISGTKRFRSMEDSAECSDQAVFNGVLVNEQERPIMGEPIVVTNYNTQPPQDPANPSCGNGYYTNSTNAV